ncbi:MULTISPECIES: hypothetical protein [Lacticaseibacillus]|uniref:Uncharacterized protein n=2 Tax=Lacticaseibacillus TaxID=2759736 RepID=A0ABW4CJ46_9LACO|nr:MULTISPECIES: hypothetical protein [Lacticaseibacillus]
MGTMPKTLAWLIVIANVILIGLVLTMHNMAAMILMAAIMLVDALNGLWGAYQHH